MPYDPRRIRGYHPPYCTCYECNEAGRQQGGKRRQNMPLLRSLRRGAIRPFRLFRSVAATALVCIVLIHVTVFAGILVYVGVQKGAPSGVLPMVTDTFTSAQDAYAGAWREVADAVSLELSRGK